VEELEHLTWRVANGLWELGLVTGDPIAIAMPMTVAAVAVYLGILAAGCVVVSIADSFAPHEIATRLRITGAKAVFTQDIVVRGGRQLSMYEKIQAAEAPLAVVIPAGKRLALPLRAGDRAWREFLSRRRRFDPVDRDPDAHINILFSSGTTGEPKAVPWNQTVPIKCAADAWLHQDVQPGDVLAWPTNIGWMMGPWLIFASLINRATMALFYDAPTGRGFCEFVQNAGVTMLGVVPSLVKTWRAGDVTRGLDWSKVRLFSSTGECSNEEDMLWLMSRARYRPVIEYCGGTEIGGGYISGTLLQPAAPATFSTPALGLGIEIRDPEGNPADNGEIFIVPPSIGLSTELLNRNHNEIYFAGTPTAVDGTPLRRHGDQIERLGAGYFRGHGRADDTMNLGGIKVSSVEIERALAAVDWVVEGAAIAVDPPGGGPSELVVYVVESPGAPVAPAEKLAALQQAVRQTLNPLFRIKEVIVTEMLPRTATNKVMRRRLRELYREQRTASTGTAP
jgi:acetyl-CoA synthetase